MKIDFANLKIGYQKYQDAFEKSMDRVLSNASYIMGPEIEELENELSNYTGSKHVITCSSWYRCTSACYDGSRYPTR